MGLDSRKTSHPMLFGLSLIAGIGLTAMMLVLGFGVIQGENADGGLLGLFFAAGLALFLFGAGGWVAVVQPHKHFDDINEPHYTGHHEEHHEADEHAPAAHP